MQLSLSFARNTPYTFALFLSTSILLLIPVYYHMEYDFLFSNYAGELCVISLR
jgi:hypothetical protein